MTDWAGEVVQRLSPDALREIRAAADRIHDLRPNVDLGTIAAALAIGYWICADQASALQSRPNIIDRIREGRGDG